MDRGPEINTGLWMVPFADLMSTLVILFLALFAYAHANRLGFEHFRAKAQEELAAHTPRQASASARRRETEVAVKIEEALKGLRLEDFGVRVSARYVHLELPEPVLFAFGSARLSPGAAPVLGALGDVLRTVDNPVIVEGHTDDRPIAGGRYRTNWELSAGRAFSVIESFLRAGLPAGRFAARGYGEHRPAASNATEEGRRRNRRIEIKLARALTVEE